MASRTITSNQSGPKLPGATTPLFIKTRTTFTPDVNGNPIGGTQKTELLYTPNGSTFFVAAESTEGGAPGSWQLRKYTPAEILNAGIAQYAQPDGTILGPTAALSLNTGGGIMYQAAQNSIKQSATSAGIPAGYQKPLASSLQNTAQSPPQPSPTAPASAPAAPTLPTPEEAAAQRSSSLSPFGSFEGNVKDTKTGNLRYPKDMRGDQDRVQFQAVTISERTGTSEGGTSGFDFNFGSPIYKPVGGAVNIAIQGPISDQSSVDWGPDTVNAIDAALYKTSIGAMGSGEQTLNTKVTEFFSNLTGTLTAEQDRIRRYLAGLAANINNVLPRTDGVVLNPNLELLFSGPQLRPFSFQFKMSARNAQEGDEIKKIINYFKYHMAVRKDDNGLFLKAPHVFKIDYYYGNELHPGINKISNNSNSKACALTNFSVDYMPLGSYMTYGDGTMVAYLLSLQFQEITPIYNTDNEGFKDKTTIGF